MKPGTPDSISLSKKVHREKPAAPSDPVPIAVTTSLAGSGDHGMGFDQARRFDPGNPLEELPERRHPAQNSLQLTRGLEQQLRVYKTLSSIIDYAYTFDRAGRFLYANQALLDLLGLTLDHVVGKNFFELPYPHDLAVRLQQQIEQVFTTSRKLIDETAYISPAGVLGYYEYIFNPVIGADGSVELVAGSTRNVTERKQSEAALLRSEKLASEGRLAAALAHEINNPLQAVVNLITLLRQSPRLDAQDLAYATMAEEELGRIAHLTQQSLSFYRDSVAPAVLNVEEVVDSVVTLYAKKTAAKRIAITRRYRSNGAAISSYPGEIRQVISTLLVNAVEAVPEGGAITIGVHRSFDYHDPRIRGVRIAIADRGVGIPAHHVDRIFDAFFTTKGAHGTGLGLWVANGILNRIGGSIRIRSSACPGKSGTCFSVFLPSQLPRQH